MEDTYPLLKLPNDIFGIIFEHIPYDKVYFSFVSTSCNKICKNHYEMFKNKNEYPMDSAYDLNLWLKEFGEINNNRNIMYYCGGINMLNVLVQHAMDNGYLYGVYLYPIEYNNQVNVSEYTKFVGNNSYVDIHETRKKYKKFVKMSPFGIFDEYCKFDVLNRYTIFISKLLLLYHGESYYNLMIKSLKYHNKNSNNKVYKYFKNNYDNKL